MKLKSSMLEGRQQCIIAIGKTGNGKSFTGTIFGAQDAKVGNSSSSQTTKVTVYDIGDSNFYVDTPGFDDSDETKSDYDTARLIFRTLLDKEVHNITTILWFVSTGIKATASFKREAKFIESLARDHDGNVWDNTIIVTKGDKIASGPREAAKEIAKNQYDMKKKRCNKLPDKNDLLVNTPDFAILLFESLESTSVYVENEFTSKQLIKYNIFKRSEPDQILAKYNALMKEHPANPIKINYRKVKCLNCPEETDPRLAIPECHLEAESFHPETINIHLYKTIHAHSNNLEEYHPGSLKTYHPGSYMFVHTGVPIDSQIDLNPAQCFIRAITFGIINPMIPGYWKCCGKKQSSPGCLGVYSCCNNDNDGCRNKYKCCGGGLYNKGCEKRYRCCNGSYTSEGCQYIYDVCKHKAGEQPCCTMCKNCNQTLDKNGCKMRCRNCKGPQTIKGCIKAEHNFNFS
ncbi:1109_t:CDS:2 [Dentiscutata heterogama]|uniref:1109_t:CDS:1 n=1 Tax=Dentiscutata heterogama TaxID=1316150 RepID=A0ACA9LNR0_9GLOM|nr:1109_t:CDS:2 [Dentiscutata heterogama]